MNRPQPITPAQRASIAASRRRMAGRARSRGWRKYVTYFIHGMLVFPLVWLLRLLPVDVASALGGWLGRTLLARLLPLKGAYRTLRVPLPGLSDAEIAVLLRSMHDNIVRVLAEIVHLGAFAGPNNPRLRLVGREHVEAARAAGPGILFIGGHFANWELDEVAIRALGLDGAKVLQHPSNPFVLGWLARQRYRWGLSEQIATGEGVFARVTAALRAGRAVQMLCDQRTVKGVKVPFCGLETTTNVVPARAARETQSPIVLMSMRRVRGANFEIVFEPPMWVAQTADREADEKAALTTINAFFEREIRAQPGLWLWGHPRWHDVFLNLPAQPLVTSSDGR